MTNSTVLLVTCHLSLVTNYLSIRTILGWKVPIISTKSFWEAMTVSMFLYAIGASSALPPMRVISLTLRAFLMSELVKRLQLSLREKARPAPCEAESKLSALPLPRTI